MVQTRSILQTIVIALNILAVIFLAITLGLFCDAYFRLNSAVTEDNSQVCILYLSESNPTPSDAPCVISIIGEFLAGAGLIILLILSVLKLVNILMSSKTVLTTEILVLVFSGVFATIGAILLSSGWGVTCETIKQLTSNLGFDCDYSYLKEITASAVFAGLAVAAIVGSFIFTIVTAVVGSRESNQWTRFTNKY